MTDHGAPLVAEVILRLLGGFYAFGSVVGLRRAAMEAFLDGAIDAIGGAEARRRTATATRHRWLAANLVLVGAGGIALLLLLAPAAPLFLLAAAGQAIWLLVVAPRLVDPWDPPDPAGRAASRRATWLYLSATAVVCVAWWREGLTPLGEADWPVLAIGGGLVAALLGVALRPARDLRPALPAAADEPRRTGLVLMPSWDEGPLFDARTGEALPSWERDALLTPEEEAMVEPWLALFAQLADPEDPWRAALRDPAELALLETGGRPIAERLQARLGRDAVVFVPATRPRPPRTVAARVRVAAVPGEPPLWSLDADPPSPFDPDHFGLSWSLARALLDWGWEVDEGTDWDAPDRPLRWTEADHAGHAARGRALAIRLARELAATGRGEVVVLARAATGEDVPVRADEPFD